MNGELVDRFLSENSLGSPLSLFMRGSAAGTTSSKLQHGNFSLLPQATPRLESSLEEPVRARQRKLGFEARNYELDMFVGRRTRTCP